MAISSPEQQLHGSPINSHDGEEDALVVRSLSFAFNFGTNLIHNFSLALPRGSRCLLCGANGAGKTTLLQILAGKYMVGQDTVRILGRPAFHDIALVSSGDLSYLGPQWRRDLAISGSGATLQGDISAGRMIFGVEGVDPARRARLISLLDVDLNWRMNRLSDGQRRRVQIALGLLKPYQVLLLDEVTVDMDVVGRLDLLDFFVQECEERGATIMYATHIFDGMEAWPTHLAYVEDGRLVRGGPVASVPELNQGRKLLSVVEGWLREEKQHRRRKLAEAAAEGAPVVAKRQAPLMPSKHMAFYRAVEAGGDHQFREIIKARYKRLVKMRQVIRSTANFQIIYITLHTAWKYLPVLTKGEDFSVIDLGIMAGSVALFLLYQYAFGFGKPQRERHWAVQVYSVGSMILVTECIVSFLKYHVFEGPTAQSGAFAAAYPAIPKAAAAALQARLGLTASAAGTAEVVLGLFEKAFDVVGIALCGYGAYVTKEFALEQKKQRAEAEKGRGHASRAE